MAVTEPAMEMNEARPEFTMKDIQINSNLNALKKFGANSKAPFKDVIPLNITYSSWSGRPCQSQ